MKRQLLIALLAGAATAASAQAVYRCGNSYGEQACGATVAVQALRAPDPADVAASRRETEREMKVADAMEKARLKEEAKPVAAYIPKEKVEPVVARKPEVFTVRVPAAKKPAKKHKRA